MRILHVMHGLSLGGGGPAVALMGLSAAQAAAGLEVSLAAATVGESDAAIARHIASRGVSVHTFGPTRGLRNHPDLAPTLERLIPHAEVVHIHALWEAVQHRAARICQRLGKPYIITPHGMLDPWALRQGRLKKSLYMLWRLRRNLRCAAALHFATRIERDLVEPLGLARRAIVEPLGIDYSEFHDLPAPGSFRARYPQLGDRPYVVYLGRLHPQKGLELLIPAFARASVGEARLVLVGPDSRGFQRQVEAWVTENGLEGRVLLTGMLTGSDRIAALADATLFALPSYHENFGVSVVEALAAGRPVIISDQVQIHQEITAAQVGAVVPLDVDALARELTAWLADPARREAAAGRCRPFVLETFEWGHIAGRWVDHYREAAR